MRFGRYIGSFRKGVRPTLIPADVLSSISFRVHKLLLNQRIGTELVATSKRTAVNTRFLIWAGSPWPCADLPAASFR